MGKLVSGIVGNIGATRAQDQAARNQEAAGRAAAEEARFRPIGVTNAFGSSNFQFDPSGRVSSAGYELNPQLAALRDQFMGMAGSNNLGQSQQALQQAQQGLFGSLANSGDIAGRTQDLYNQRQSLMAPGREQQLSELRNQVFQSGRSGLSVGGTNAGGYAAANPEMQAYFNAQRQQDNAMLTGAEQDARNYRANDMQTLGGLFGLQQQALSPTMSYLQGAQGIEGIGKDAFNTSLQLGQLNQNQRGADALYNSGMASAQSRLGAANSRNAGWEAALNPLGGVLKNVPIIGGLFG